MQLCKSIYMYVCIYTCRPGIAHIPSSLELKKELLAEFKRVKKPQKLNTDFDHIRKVNRLVSYRIVP